MSTYRLISILCLGLLLLRPEPAVAAGAPEKPIEATCFACLVVDESGNRLWARRAEVPVPNASTTKMATALLVMKEAELDDQVTVSQAAASTGGGGLDLLPGDVYELEDLLYALLLTSSNDAAVALAEHSAGTVEAFMADLNPLVDRLGAHDTHFETPHGLDEPGHVSTAWDLALLAGEVLEDPVLSEIVATPAIEIEGPKGTIELENRNVLLEGYRGAIGVKTGYTLLAGNVLVAAAERDDRTLISVALRSVDAAADSRLLLDYGFERLSRTVLVRADQPVGDLVMDPGGAATVVAGRTSRGSSTEVSIRFVPDEGLDAGIEVGDRVGSILVEDGGTVVDTVPAVAAEEVESSEQPWVTDLLGGIIEAGHRIGQAVGLI